MRPTGREIPRCGNRPGPAERRRAAELLWISPARPDIEWVMQRLAGKVVLVTGASKGIGRALALGCAREGADVIVNYHTDRDGAAAAVSDIEACGRRALAIQADVGKPKQI